MPGAIIGIDSIISKRQLCQYYGVSMTTIKKWLKGEGYDFDKNIKSNTIPPKKVKEIIEILGEK